MQGLLRRILEPCVAAVIIRLVTECRDDFKAYVETDYWLHEAFGTCSQD